MAEQEILEARAVQRFLRRAPRKVRLVADHVRGENVQKALKKLEFVNKASAPELAKVITSAAANFRDKHDEDNMPNENLYIKELRVDEGTTLKRIKPRAMGRANQIRKRTSHITVVVAEQDAETIKE